jgi:thiamine-monophosphate kinase
MIRALERIFARGPGLGKKVELGIGDDASVLRIGPERLVWTVDACVQGVHFQLGWLSLREVGWRSLVAAASDLGAMGARPLGALSSLVLPPGFSRQELIELGRGQNQAARELGCPVLGGNLSRGSELSIVTTVLGSCKNPLLRSRARPGDELWLVGEVGLARAGLELLSSGQRSESAAAKRAIRAWRRPIALIERGLELGRVARAALDVSDGLSGDAVHLAESSRVRVVIEAVRLEKALPRALRQVGDLLGIPPLELALLGGEDYALLAAGARGRRPSWAHAIGRIERGQGVVIEAEDGTRRRAEGGFDHFG